jgi:hypothetical protein
VVRPSSTSWTSSWTATPRGGPEPQPLPNTCQIFRCLFLVPYSAWLARLRLIRSPKLQGESGRPVRGSSRSRLRTPASAGHSAQPSTGRDGGGGEGGGHGGVWARCGGNGWGECGEAMGIFGWERNLAVERRTVANARFPSRERCGPATGGCGNGNRCAGHGAPIPCAICTLCPRGP